jgi:hypothetical protein
MGTDAENTKQGKLLENKGYAWHTQCDHIRTFLTVHGAKNTLCQLKIILESVST